MCHNLTTHISQWPTEILSAEVYQQVYSANMQGSRSGEDSELSGALQIGCNLVLRLRGRAKRPPSVPPISAIHSVKKRETEVGSPSLSSLLNTSDVLQVNHVFPPYILSLQDLCYSKFQTAKFLNISRPLQ